MKERYLTVTDFTVTLDQRVLGRGRLIVPSDVPQGGTMGDPGALLKPESMQMGVFCPEPDAQGITGSFAARLEGLEGFFLTLTKGRFSLMRRRQAQDTAIRRAVP